MAIGPRMSLLKRLASFALTVGASTVIGILAIPVIISKAGADLWGVQATVQAGAAMFGVAVAFGWGTTGAGIVASSPASLRPQLFVDSLVSRVYLYLLTLPMMVLVLTAMNPAHFDLVVAGSIAYLLPFLGASWYFVGEARPARLFRLDALPQLLGVVAGLLVILQTGRLVDVLAVQAVFNLLAVVVSTIAICRGAAEAPKLSLSPSAAFRRLGSQRHGVITAATGSLYVNLPLLVVYTVLPASLPVYALGDKLFKYALAAFSPVLQFIQGWIPEGGPESLRHRISRSAQVAPVIGLAGAVAIAVLGPLVAGPLSQGKVPLDLSVSLPFGVIFFAVAWSQVVGLACLVPINRTKALAVSTVLGAIAGTPLIFAGALMVGLLGVAWAVAISELVVVGYQLTVLRSYLSSRTAATVGSQ